MPGLRSPVPADAEDVEDTGDEEPRRPVPPPRRSPSRPERRPVPAFRSPTPADDQIDIDETDEDDEDIRRPALPPPRRRTPLDPDNEPIELEYTDFDDI
jgi:hypothetical protein